MSFWPLFFDLQGIFNLLTPFSPYLSDRLLLHLPISDLVNLKCPANDKQSLLHYSELYGQAFSSVPGAAFQMTDYQRMALLQNLEVLHCDSLVRIT